jgi:hypothetical protein
MNYPKGPLAAPDDGEVGDYDHDITQEPDGDGPTVQPGGKLAEIMQFFQQAQQQQMLTVLQGMMGPPQ